MNRAVAVGAALLLATAATAYGTLDGDTRGPALALAGAMAIAAGAALAPLLPIATTQTTGPRMVTTSPALLAIAWGSAQAAVIHFAVIPQHFEEYWLYGWFFVLVGVAQLASAYLVIARPRRWVLLTIAVGNLALVVVWVLSRTYGALIGPDATEPADAGFGDIVATVLELGIAVLAVALCVRSTRLVRGPSGRRRELVNVLMLLVLTLVSVLALYSTVAGKPFVSHVG